MTDTTELDRIMRRVQKLLAIAKDSRADPNEAAAAASQAENIMRKFQIEHADIVKADLLRAENFDGKDVPAGLSTRSEGWTLWAQTLALAVAELHDCQVRKEYSRATGAALSFIGYKSDTQVAQWTFLYLLNCMQRDAAALKKQYPHATRHNMDAFRMGYVSALQSRLKDAARAKAAEMRGESGNRDLVLTKTQAISERFGDMEVRSTTSKLGQEAGYGNGLRAGATVDISARAIQSDQDSGPLRLA